MAAFKFVPQVFKITFTKKNKSLIKLLFKTFLRQSFNYMLISFSKLHVLLADLEEVIPC